MDSDQLIRTRNTVEGEEQTPDERDTQQVMPPATPAQIEEFIDNDLDDVGGQPWPLFRGP